MRTTATTRAVPVSASLIVEPHDGRCCYRCASAPVVDASACRRCQKVMIMKSMESHDLLGMSVRLAEGPSYCDELLVFRDRVKCQRNACDTLGDDDDDDDNDGVHHERDDHDDAEHVGEESQDDGDGDDENDTGQSKSGVRDHVAESHDGRCVYGCASGPVVKTATCRRCQKMFLKKIWTRAICGA